jgi:FKBP-type peptidyl-prolyl cis-trans isomerase
MGKLIKGSWTKAVSLLLHSKVSLRLFLTDHAGWEESIIGMSLGEKSKLTIPPELAYGDHTFPGYVPANATLIFEVELKEINKKTMNPEGAGGNPLISRSGEGIQQRVPDLYD